MAKWPLLNGVICMTTDGICSMLAVCVCDNTLHGVIRVMTDGICNMSGRLGSVCL